jgi:light-regulated signal transduction histidine kinase (bacteriophytochrome)
LKENSLHIPQIQNYDSEVCGSIPLQFMNLVQPHGVMLVLDVQNNYTIVQGSKNAEQIINYPINQLLGKPLTHIVSEDQVTKLVEKLDRWTVSSHFPYNLTLKNEPQKEYNTLIHRRKDYIVLELEAQGQADHEAFNLLYKEISYIIAAAKEAPGVLRLCEVAVHELKRLSGFERVMVYKFDDQWNGTVVAEAREDDMESYLDLRFPASDIPPQARELYHRTPYRLIPNTEAQPTKLSPVVNPLTNSLTDISQCILRGVPLVHLEYLKNMGVKASMSTPILINDTLWGLISCHNRSAQYLSNQVRSVFEVVSGVIAAQLSSRVKEEEFEHHSHVHGLKLNLIEQVFNRNSFAESLIEQPETLKGILNVHGVALIGNGQWHTSGQVPETDNLTSLHKWLIRYNRQPVMTTDSLAREFPEATEFRHVGSGLIAIQITDKLYLLGFRPEQLVEVNWGGNPNDRITYNDEGTEYHPRNSFKQWREQVEYTSKPWRNATIEAAQHLRTALLEKMVQMG